MINLDNYKAKRDELLKGVTDAITVNDPEQIKNSLAELNDFMVKDFKAIADDISASTDSTILASRGVRQLTANETKFYENFIQKAKAAAASCMCKFLCNWYTVDQKEELQNPESRMALNWNIPSDRNCCCICCRNCLVLLVYRRWGFGIVWRPA